jgi:hypothetical protein
VLVAQDEMVALATSGEGDVGEGERCCDAVFMIDGGDDDDAGG